MKLGRGSRGGGLAIATAVCLIMLLSPMAGAAAHSFKRTLPPFEGSHTSSDLPFARGSSHAKIRNATYFNPSNGAGGFAISSWANSKHTVAYGAPYAFNTSESSASASLQVYLKIPFASRSGTRTLSSVALHLTFSIRGQVTMVPGSCPYLNSTGRNTTCSTYAQSEAWIDPGTLTWLGSGHVTRGICSISNGTARFSHCLSVNEQSNSVRSNSSTGLSSSYKGANGTTPFDTGKWNVTILFKLAKPVNRSKMMTASFDIVGDEDSELLVDSAAAGAFSGARDSAALVVAIQLESISET